MSLEVYAPMEGKILNLIKQAGDTVAEDEVIIVLEAMKMEIEIVSPASGTIEEIKVSEGDKVEADSVLAVLAES